MSEGSRPGGTLAQLPDGWEALATTPPGLGPDAGQRGALDGDRAGARSVAALADPPPGERRRGVAGAPLDLHKEITAEDKTGGCKRWPENLRLEAAGRLVPGRCKSTNLCEYCARLMAVETVEILALDAMRNSAPAVWSVLTTRTATLDVKGFQRAREAVTREVRRKWPDAERAMFVEYQTGRGLRAGGQRRPHWNDLWKGIPASDVDDLRERTSWAWCKRVDAEPEGQFAGEVREAGGLMRYLALHFFKQEQQPPVGWRGHRFRVTEGYLAERMKVARAEAREVLQQKRDIRRAEMQGHEGLAALEVAELAALERAALTWELVRLTEIPATYDETGFPATWQTITSPVRG